MDKTYLTFMVTVSVLLLLTFIGCGSGEQAAEVTVTKAQFGRQADKICSAAAEDQFTQAGLYLTKHPGTQEVDLVVPVAVPPLEQELRELTVLPAPGSETDEVRALLRELKRALRKIKEDPEAALSSTNNPYEKANAIAKHLKTGDCGGNP